VSQVGTPGQTPKKEPFLDRVLGITALPGLLGCMILLMMVFSKQFKSPFFWILVVALAWSALVL
jgi:hypothetical protein